MLHAFESNRAAAPARQARLDSKRRAATLGPVGAALGRVGAALGIALAALTAGCSDSVPQCDRPYPCAPVQTICDPCAQPPFTMDVSRFDISQTPDLRVLEADVAGAGDERDATIVIDGIQGKRQADLTYIYSYFTFDGLSDHPQMLTYTTLHGVVHLDLAFVNAPCDSAERAAVCPE